MRAVRVGIVILLLPLLLASCVQASPCYPFEVVCFDVGQGDCTLLRTEEGDILIDAGTEASQTELCRRLKVLGVERLRLLLLTHPDEDHVGGGDGVLENFSVDALWVNGSTEKNESLLRLLESASTVGLSPRAVTAGDYASVGGVTLTVLSPFDTETAVGNEGSIVLSVCFGEQLSFLMMGDAGEETERALLDAYGPTILRADLLHVGHHGANASGHADFLKAVQPRYAIVSCGEGNSYGHPDGRALARLGEVGAEVYRTDLYGEIHIGAEENGRLVWTFPFAEQ